MIGVFSYNIEKYGLKGNYVPCLTSDIHNKYVFGIQSKGSYGPVVPVTDKYNFPCDNKTPPPNVAVIVQSHCKGKTGASETYWFNADCGLMFVPVDGTNPILWPLVTEAQLKETLEAVAGGWSNEDITFFMLASIPDKLVMIQELNDMATVAIPKPIPKPVLPTNPYKWILKNGVVSFPEQVSTQPKPVMANTTNFWTSPASSPYSPQDIHDILNSLTTSNPTGEF